MIVPDEASEDCTDPECTVQGRHHHVLVFPDAYATELADLAAMGSDE